MDFRDNRIIRIISSIVLAFFLWTFGGVFEIAHSFSNSAVGKNSPQYSVQSQKQKEQGPEEKFQDALEKIRNAEEKIDGEIGRAEAIEDEETEIKNQKAEIGKLDVEIRKQFADTEAKIKNLPEVIKQRHRDFVEKYEENLNILNASLEDIEKAKTIQEKFLAHKKAKEFLEKIKPSKHKPLDPNKLPHRTAEPIFKKPRTKPEQFPKDSSQQTVAGSQKKTKPLLVAANGPLDGLLSAEVKNFLTSQLPDLQTGVLYALADPPTSADLSETIEVQFTPEIKAKAEELGKNPVKIYEYVKNEFFFEAYYGSLKGAHETLLEKAGNDFDQASLLISLLRASNIPARYIYGTIEVPIERVKKWLGVESETIAGEILSANGIPVSLINEGGKISKVRLEHVWIEAWVSYDNYRGHPDSQNKIWIPLDASFKQVQYTRGPDIKQIMNFDPNAFIDELKAHSTYSTSDYSVSHVDETFMQQKLQEYQTRLDDYITSNIPNAKPQDLIGKFDILYEKFGILPATLSYKVIVKGAAYTAIPDALRHKLKIEIQSTDYFGSGNINYQTNLSQLAGKKITISYLPATIADDTTLKSYGALSLVPAYLVNMKPVLMIDGAVAAIGGEIGLGKNQQINLTFTSPNISTDMVTHNMTAGGYHAIGIDLQRIPKALMQKQTDRMQAMKTYLESIISGNPSTPPEGDSRDNLIGDMLYDVAVNYFYNLDAMNDLMSRVSDMIWIRQPSEAMAFVDLKVNSMFGIPFTAKPVGMSIDVDGNIISPFHMSGDKNIEKAFKMQSGMYMSAMEHIIFEWMFNVNAVSTVKILQQANTLSIPLYAVTSQNVGQILPVLQVSSSVKSDIQNAVNAGMVVIIPQAEITLNNWQGIGYIVQNPDTLAGAYRISGGINGGSTSDDTFNYMNSCTVIGDWEKLLNDVDILLSIANALLLGNVDLRGLADELCVLLQGISPMMPEADYAKEILRQFEDDVVAMIIAISATQIPIITSGGGLIRYSILTIEKAILSKHYGLTGNIFEYSGYFTIHYLYEYIVLFRAGLIDAFPKF